MVYLLYVSLNGADYCDGCFRNREDAEAAGHRQETYGANWRIKERQENNGDYVEESPRRQVN